MNIEQDLNHLEREKDHLIVCIKNFKNKAKKYPINYLPTKFYAKQIIKLTQDLERKKRMITYVKAYQFNKVKGI